MATKTAPDDYYQGSLWPQNFECGEALMSPSEALRPDLFVGSLARRIPCIQLSGRHDLAMKALARQALRREITFEEFLQRLRSIFREDEEALKGLLRGARSREITLT